MAEGILYDSDLVKLLSATVKENREVLFEMEDGTLKSMSDIKDFHTVKNPLKPELIQDRILTTLFGSDAKKGKSLDAKHLEYFFGLLNLVLDSATEATIKKTGEKFEITIRRGPDTGKKILSELLRE